MLRRAGAIAHQSRSGHVSPTECRANKQKRGNEIYMEVKSTTSDERTNVINVSARVLVVCRKAAEFKRLS